MLFDPNGLAPELWQWTISGAMAVAGIVLIATGVGGITGGVLVCAGANSLIGSYVSEATGGSSLAGWAGGMITGATCGTGAGLAGNLFIQATNTVGFTCLGILAASVTVAAGSGSAGSAIGQVVSAAIDDKQIDTKEAVYTSMTTGTINILSGIGVGIGTALSQLPTIGTTSVVLANSLNAGWSLLCESICDLLSTVAGMFA